MTAVTVDYALDLARHYREVFAAKREVTAYYDIKLNLLPELLKNNKKIEGLLDKSHTIISNTAKQDIIADLKKQLIEKEQFTESGFDDIIRRRKVVFDSLKKIFDENKINTSEFLGAYVETISVLENVFAIQITVNNNSSSEKSIKNLQLPVPLYPKDARYGDAVNTEPLALSHFVSCDCDYMFGRKSVKEVKVQELFNRDEISSYAQQGYLINWQPNFPLKANSSLKCLFIVPYSSFIITSDEKLQEEKLRIYKSMMKDSNVRIDGIDRKDIPIRPVVNLRMEFEKIKYFVIILGAFIFTLALAIQFFLADKLTYKMKEKKEDKLIEKLVKKLSEKNHQKKNSGDGTENDEDKPKT